MKRALLVLLLMVLLGGAALIYSYTHTQEAPFPPCEPQVEYCL